MLLEARDISVNYGKVEAVKGVSFQVAEADVVTILGANGAGKTTILKAISGLKHLTSGEILFCDKRIDGRKPSRIVRLGIGHVPEGAHVFPDMNVQDNLALGAFARKDRKDIKQDLAKIFAHFPVLRRRSRQKAGSLSGGEQQMLAIGRAMMCKPRLLLMDEPTIGLSPILIGEIEKIIVFIRENGVSVFLVEQNAGLALKLANSGYVVENGQIALSGTREELIMNEEVKKVYLGG
jgi:branched-chain amino acid transport system ATP-binding protein